MPLINYIQQTLTDGSALTGVVHSVALSLPAIISVSGSPITNTGTLTGTLATQSANTLWSGPTTGSAAAPTFRTMVLADLPAGVALLGSANAFTIGGHTITNASAAIVPLTIKGASSQSGDLLSFRNSANIRGSAIDPNGGFYTDGGIDSVAISLISKSTATQNLIECRDGSVSLNGPQFYVDAHAVLHATVSGYAGLGLQNTFTTGGQAINNSSDVVGLSIKGHSTQTSVLQNWKNNSNTVVASISNTGVVTGVGTGLTGIPQLGSANAFTVGGHTIVNASATIGLSLKGFSLQSDNILEVKDSTNTVQFSVKQTGAIVGNGAGITSLSASNISSGTLSNSRLSGVALLASANAFTVGGHTLYNSTDVIPLIIKGHTTQTSDLLRVQSTGAVNQFTITGDGKATMGDGAVDGLKLTIAGDGNVSNNVFKITCNSSGVFAIGPNGEILTSQCTLASSTGSVIKKLEIYDENGSGLGFIPIYDSL